MKICVVGKYPPIEGGVSAQTYWLSRGMARRGHEIYVVTNADEVEETFRMLLEPDDREWFEPRFKRTGGRVRVYNVQPFSKGAMGHIPEGNPFVSKLASVATDIVRREACQAILAYYYEPYAVAGWLASRWTGVPLIVKHAGSDLDRLFAVPDLATTYKEILRSADAVVTRQRLMPRFLGMGVRPEHLCADVPYAVPTEVFHPGVAPLDIARLAVEFGGTKPRAKRRAFDPLRPSIGFYGKIGSSKGTFDLIAALGALAQEGLEFNLLALIGRVQGEWLVPTLREFGLLERTFVIPLLPNWKVPSFIRACTAVCFLERDFPIAIHGPIVPREVLACGTCLVLSGEIAGKQLYRQLFEPGHNLRIAEDPKDHAALADVLRSVVSDPERARAIGMRGLEISRAIERDVDYGAGWDQLLSRCVAAGSVEARSADAPAAGSGRSPVAGLNAALPEFMAFVRRRCPDLIDQVIWQIGDQNVLVAAARLCRAAKERFEQADAPEEMRKLAAALRYLDARLVTASEPSDAAPPTFVVVDCLRGGAVTRDSVGHLWPVQGTSVRIEEFAWDVSAVFPPLAIAGQVDAHDPEAAVAALRPEPMLVLFHRSPNLVTREMRIDEATRALLDRCDGTRTTIDVVRDVARLFGLGAAEPPDEFLHRVLSALERLYQDGIIVFAERKAGWGWTGGDRTPGVRSGADHGDRMLAVRRSKARGAG